MLGDKVRIRNKKKQFERAYEPKFSELHTITDIIKHRAVLDDGSSVDLRRLKKVDGDTVTPIKKVVLKDALKESKIKRNIAKEHLEIIDKDFENPLNGC